MTPASKLFGIYEDALLLWGASVVAFVVLSVYPIAGDQYIYLAGLMLVLANFVNHPHFAHSYQLFYGSWAHFKRQELTDGLRIRWLFAGFLVPVVLVILLGVGAYKWHAGDGFWMGLSVNLMGALVGWHYVKQGFGMALTDAAVKKLYWPGATRKALLWNAYACWVFAWLMVNSGGFGGYFWGIFSSKLTLPSEFVFFVGSVVSVASATASVLLFRTINDWRAQGVHWRQMPLNGLGAYIVSIYLWTVFSGLNAAYFLVIPFFHSMQYLTVVWRYKLNEAALVSATSSSKSRSLLRFALLGLVLGALGFWLLPGAVDYFTTGTIPRASGYTSVALASAWLFINVHHYFIDSVLWRQGNPNVNRYLFGKSIPLVRRSRI